MSVDPKYPADPLYSLAHLTLINCTPAELVYVAARAGYDAVSPRFIPMNVPGEFTHPPLDKAQVQATKDGAGHNRAQGPGYRTRPHHRRLRPPRI